jgi:hypothetical protein
MKTIRKLSNTGFNKKQKGTRKIKLGSRSGSKHRLRLTNLTRKREGKLKSLNKLRSWANFTAQ